MTLIVCVLGVVVVLASGCGRSSQEPSGPPIAIDGSSTLFPLSRAAADSFTGGMVNVVSSGTRDGLARFCRGETDIADASRAITVDEQRACATAGVDFIELPIALDAITVVVHMSNTCAPSMTVAELRQLWAPAADGKVTRWSQVRPGWPDRALVLFGPGTESGTYDFFTDAINGTAGASRRDYTASADDEAIVTGVTGNHDALGFVGHSYYERHRRMLKAVAIDDEDDRVGRGAIEPSSRNALRGSYRPLSRPLFIYVSARSAGRPEVESFVRHYLRQAPELAARTASIPLMKTTYDLATTRFTSRKAGTMYGAPDSASMSIDLLLMR